MSKKLILGIALSLVLVSGTLFSAQAECLSGCLPHFAMPSFCGLFSCLTSARDRDVGEYNPYPERVHAITAGCLGDAEIR